MDAKQMKSKGVLVKHLIEELEKYDGDSHCMVWVGGSVGFASLYLDGQGDDPNDPVEFSFFPKGINDE